MCVCVCVCACARVRVRVVCSVGQGVDFDVLIPSPWWKKSLEIQKQHSSEKDGTRGGKNRPDGYGREFYDVSSFTFTALKKKWETENPFDEAVLWLHINGWMAFRALAAALASARRARGLGPALMPVFRASLRYLSQHVSQRGGGRWRWRPPSPGTPATQVDITQPGVHPGGRLSRYLGKYLCITLTAFGVGILRSTRIVGWTSSLFKWFRENDWKITSVVRCVFLSPRCSCLSPHVGGGYRMRRKQSANAKVLSDEDATASLSSCVFRTKHLPAPKKENRRKVSSCLFVFSVAATHIIMSLTHLSRKKVTYPGAMFAQHSRGISICSPGPL